MTLSDRAAAILAAIKGQQAASAKAVADAEAAQKAAEDKLTAVLEVVGDPVALGATLDSIAALLPAQP